MLRSVRAELTLLELDAVAIAGEAEQVELRIASGPNETMPVRAILSEQCQHAVLWVSLADAAVGNRRVIELQDVPPSARARTLAVALVELVRAQRNKAEAALRERNAQPTTEEVAAKPSPPIRAGEPPTTERNAASPASSPPRGRLQLGLSGLATLAFSGPGQMFGGELSSSLRQSSAFRWSIEASYARSRPATEFGRLDVQRWGLAVGGDFNFDDAPGLVVGPRLSVVELFALGHSRIGVKEERQHGFGLSLGACVGFEVPVFRGWLLRSTLDAGATLRSMTFTAGGRPAFSYDGLQAEWGIGAAFNF